MFTVLKSVVGGALGTAPQTTLEILSACPVTDSPYSAGVRVGNTTYVSGRTGGDPLDGLVPGGIGPETRQALNAIRRLLQVYEYDLNTVVKVTVYLADMNDYEEMNEVYSEIFKNHYPARSVVQAIYVPEGSRLIVDAIAVGKSMQSMKITSSPSLQPWAVGAMLE
ncbi:2-iminobutanoate/2-iminopropanoate deaminase-like [Ixodes scapularis]|uniref:2-iminobutanoate/2-iminopropanoate deaminase-like n=1 Tax=Ixodes scapularis TaxID=6945 RepID=UPI001A9E118F|nr:2-iminobutanoate/2-iminopropanoate deaminase-like [Ixodes scapularis]